MLKMRKKYKSKQFPPLILNCTLVSDGERGSQLVFPRPPYLDVQKPFYLFIHFIHLLLMVFLDLRVWASRNNFIHLYFHQFINSSIDFPSPRNPFLHYWCSLYLRHRFRKNYNVLQFFYSVVKLRKQCQNPQICIAMLKYKYKYMPN